MKYKRNMEQGSNGVLEYWSIGVLERDVWQPIIPSLHHSIPPILHHST